MILKSIDHSMVIIHAAMTVLTIILKLLLCQHSISMCVLRYFYYICKVSVCELLTVWPVQSQFLSEAGEILEIVYFRKEQIYVRDSS